MIFLIRHGQTALNHSKVVQPFDTPLDATGKEQAARLGAYLQEKGIRRILCSDQDRALMTARPLEQLSGVDVETIEDLRERNFGDIRGQAYADLKVNIFAPDYHPPGGETHQFFKERVARGWQTVTRVAGELRAEGPDGTLAVITHGLVIAAILEHHVSREDGLPRKIRHNASISTIESEPPFRLLEANAIHHLENRPGAGGVV